MTESGTGPLVWGYPKPGPRLIHAYQELDLALNGTDAQRRALGNLGTLPRPWIPSTCRHVELRGELWEWLDRVVVWLNHEFVFHPEGIVPACWPRHAHLVHEIAVLADRRWQAEISLTSGTLEEWHHYVLPPFVDRMRTRCGSHCDDGHPERWPARLDYEAFTGVRSRVRAAAFSADLDRLPADSEGEGPGCGRFVVLDTATGEVAT